MILPDANLLIYAHDSTSRFHAPALKWWNGCLNGSETVLMTGLSMFAFVRIVTNPRVFSAPLSVEEANLIVSEWLECPICHFTGLTADDVPRVFQLLEAAGVAGNLTTDAQLAAIALRTGAVVHSADSDFARFPGLRWMNPILRP